MNNSVVAQVVAPILPPREEDIVSMPYIKLNSCNCNCTSFPILGDVMIAGNDEASLNFERDSHNRSIQASSSIAEPVQPTISEDQSSDEEIQAFSETFNLKGSTFHKEFQIALQKCKQKLIENMPVELQLAIEPVNVEDENAIVVQVNLDGISTAIGYIPGRKVQKVQAALNNNEIINLALTRVQYKYIWGAGIHKYIPQLTITKNGRWLKDDNKYQYNSIFS